MFLKKFLPYSMTLPSNPPIMSLLGLSAGFFKISRAEFFIPSGEGSGDFSGEGPLVGEGALAGDFTGEEGAESF